VRQRQADATAPGPLAGVRAIELASVVMGPLAGQILGDLGADVIKVETDAAATGQAAVRTWAGWRSTSTATNAASCWI